MKKWTIIVASLVLALVSSAANIQWGISTCKSDQGMFNDLEPDYLNYGVTFTLKLGSLVLDSHLYTQPEWANDGGFKSTIVDVDQAAWFKAVGIPGVDDFTWADYNGAFAFTIEATVSVGGVDYIWSSSVGLTGMNNGQGASSLGDAQLTGNTIIHLEPVPEPTSMALLALGAAAVGLRRRFRK